MMFIFINNHHHLLSLSAAENDHIFIPTTMNTNKDLGDLQNDKHNYHHNGGNKEEENIEVNHKKRESGKQDKNGVMHPPLLRSKYIMLDKNALNLPKNSHNSSDINEEDQNKIISDRNILLSSPISNSASSGIKCVFEPTIKAMTNSLCANVDSNSEYNNILTTNTSGINSFAETPPLQPRQRQQLNRRTITVDQPARKNSTEKEVRTFANLPPPKS